jgi:hypothetical protein
MTHIRANSPKTCEDIKQTLMAFETTDLVENFDSP